MRRGRFNRTEEETPTSFSGVGGENRNELENKGSFGKDKVFALPRHDLKKFACISLANQ